MVTHAPASAAVSRQQNEPPGFGGSVSQSSTEAEARVAQEDAPVPVQLPPAAMHVLPTPPESGQITSGQTYFPLTHELGPRWQPAGIGTALHSVPAEEQPAPLPAEPPAAAPPPPSEPTLVSPNPQAA